MSGTPLWRQYLLGELSESEQDRLELEILESELATPGLTDAEDALIEDYLDGGLAAAERERFDAYFLESPDHRRSLEASRVLRAAMAARPAARPRSALPAAAWMGLLAAAVAAVVFGLQHRTEPPTTSPRSVAAATAADPRTTPVKIASLTLSPGRVMSASGEARVVLASGLEVLRLELIVEDASIERASVAVAASDRGEVWAGEARLVRVEGGATVVVDVPVSSLSAGAYEVTVRREPDRVPAGTYHFRTAQP